MSDDLDDLLERLVPGAGHRATTDADAPPFPTALTLEPVDVLARGSVGWVYRARDPVLDRTVAVKVSRPEGGAAAREALLNEARTTARLAHPSVLPVHGVQAADGLLCVIFALGPTTTLALWQRAWRRDPDRAWSSDQRLTFLQGVTSAVAHAHALNVVHGDLSPANLAVDNDGHPYVLDWSGLVARQGTFSGTPEFAAPEQLAGQAPIPASDVFALAAIAWDVLTDRPLRRWPEGLSPAELVVRLTDAALPDAPPQGVDPELGELLHRAASPEPANRPPASDLLTAITDVRSGRARRLRRRSEAEEKLARARREWLAFGERERRLEEERRVAAVQRARIPPHAPPEAKTGLWASELRAERLLDEQARSWTTTAEHAMAAVQLEPGLDEAHAVLAELWYERLRLAEAHDTPGERELILDRIKFHDRGRFNDLFEGQAEITIEGQGKVRLIEVVSNGRRRIEHVRETVALPLERRPIPAGSWVVEQPTSTGPALRQPVALSRLEHVVVHVPLAPPVPDDFCFVPEGRFRMGGDRRARGPVDPCSPWLPGLLVGRTAVTSQAYLTFLRTLAPDEAALRVPAQRLVTGRPEPLWTSEKLELPDGWSPDWPVVGVSLEDAAAYANWSSAQTGLPLRLPTEDEWEKLARGADGRAYPWGEAFDACWCHMRDSLPGGPRIGPVAQFPDDRSPYGVLDVAGGVHEWTTSVLTEQRHVIRGGSWASDAQACRLASRTGLPAHSRLATLGFRLVATWSGDVEDVVG
ncbi:MAG: bifunctional serine/threonine-protein kinase/formylglycine-generating enzyme family protein [Myxococcota bacterium]